MLPAFITQSLLQAVQTLSFFIPGHVGTQEGSLAFLMGFFYFSPAGGVALSLIKRARQLIWGVLAIPFYFYFKNKSRATLLLGTAIMVAVAFFLPQKSLKKEVSDRLPPTALSCKCLKYALAIAYHSHLRQLSLQTEKVKPQKKQVLVAYNKERI